MSTEPDWVEPLDDERYTTFVAVVVEHKDRPDECTIYPLHAGNRDERRSTWITARDDAFVERSAVR